MEDFSTFNGITCLLLSLVINNGKYYLRYMKRDNLDTHKFEYINTVEDFKLFNINPIVCINLEHETNSLRKSLYKLLNNDEIFNRNNGKLNKSYLEPTTKNIERFIKIINDYKNINNEYYEINECSLKINNDDLCFNNITLIENIKEKYIQKEDDPEYDPEDDENEENEENEDEEDDDEYKDEYESNDDEYEPNDDDSKNTKSIVISDDSDDSDDEEDNEKVLQNTRKRKNSQVDSDDSDEDESNLDNEKPKRKKGRFMTTREYYNL